MAFLSLIATTQIYLQAVPGEPEITEEWEINQYGEYELVRAYIQEDLSYLPNTNPQSHQPWYDEF